MKRFALIGHPVAGSLSPRLFAAAYQGRYTYDLVDEADFDTAWGRFLDGYDGINITAPFKEEAFRRCDVLSPAARRCAAVNLAIRTERGIVGYNTDVDGVREAVRETGRAVEEVLVVGCGGAGRAAGVAALEQGWRVTLVNRTPGRAEALAAALSCRWIPWEALAGERPQLVIDTVPGFGRTLLPPAALLQDAMVLEADYRHPSLSQLPCRRYVGGQRWLLHQAVAGYALFTGETPDAAKMAEIFVR